MEVTKGKYEPTLNQEGKEKCEVCEKHFKSLHVHVAMAHHMDMVEYVKTVLSNKGVKHNHTDSSLEDEFYFYFLFKRHPLAFTVVSIVIILSLITLYNTNK